MRFGFPAVHPANSGWQLALGASTENRLPGEPPYSIEDDFDLTQLTDEELSAFQQLLVKITRRREKPPGGGTIP